MNILFISPNSPHESIGGVERYIINLLHYSQNQTEFNTYFILPTSKDSYVEKQGNTTIYYENSLLLTSKSGKNQKEISIKSQQFSLAIEQIIKVHGIDVICVENFHISPPAFSLVLHMKAGLYNIPLVLQLHSFAATSLQTELINQLMWSQVTCVSKSVTGDCFQKGMDINYLSTHYLGVNTAEFNEDAALKSELKKELKLPDEIKIVLTATRIILGKKNILQQKGIINLLQAFSKLAPRYPNLRLVIAVGKPPDTLKDEFNLAYEMLEGYIKLHNVEDVTIIKMFSLEEMPKVYRGSDLFVLASENETFGQVFIESMACGLPVIGTKVGGIPEIISDSYNGYLVHPDDSSLLAQKIETLLFETSIREKFIEAGKKTVLQTFTLEKQLLNFFHSLEKIVLEAKTSTFTTV